MALRTNPDASFRSFEYRYLLACPLPTVFAIYTDTNRWCSRGFVDDVSWVQGEPWKEGSRIRVKISEPVSAVVDQVLAHFERDRELAYISHVFGMTFSTRLTFRAISEEQTEIYVFMEVVGIPWRLFNFAIEPTIDKTTRRFFEGLTRDCEWAALQAQRNAAIELEANS